LDGADGALFSHKFNPVVWQIEWPREVKECYKNCKLNNNDLEMAAIVAQTIVLEHLVPMRHRHTTIYSKKHQPQAGQQS
jgi:hypothetical protein